MSLKKNILLLIAFSISLSCFAQGGFRKRYYLQNSIKSVCRGAIELQNGNILMTGFTIDTVGQKIIYKLTVLCTNPLGSILWRKDYGTLNHQYIESVGKSTYFEVIDSSGFYQSMPAKDSLNNYFSVLLKFNYNGDTLWEKRFYSNLTNVNLYFAGMTKSVDGGFLITGSYEDFNLPQRPCLVLKTDMNGSELWRKKIDKNLPNVNPGASILQDSATRRILIVGYQYINTGNSSESYSNVLILDSLGNKLLQTTFNNAGGFVFGKITQLKDGNFISSGQWKEFDSLGVDFYKALVVKFDVYGNIIWSKKINDALPYNIFDMQINMPNGDIVLTGTYAEAESDIIMIQLLKMDINGNTKWHRIFSNATNYDNSDGPTHLYLTKDAGFLMTTGYYSLPNPRPYSIIKIDSTGCDTTEAWCRSVILSSSNFYKIKGYNFEMFPNPATENVNFKIDAPLDNNFILKITDISGREIKKIEFEPNLEIVINTSQYQSGVYFVTVYYEQKAIEMKRLLIAR
jgi:hypothetical protein